MRNNEVPIKQSEKYYRQRVNMNLKQGRLIDALRLLGKLRQQKPDDAELMLEESVLLSRMKLVEKSSELISEAMLRQCDQPKLVHALFENLLARDMESKAAALIQNLPEGNVQAECTNRLVEYHLDREYERRHPALKRREAYALKLMKHGVDLISSGEAKRGKELVKRSLNLCEDSAYVTAMYAVTLAGYQNPDAGEYAVSACQKLRQDSDFSVKVLCARALALCGYRNKATQLLRSMRVGSLLPRERTQLFCALSECGLHAEIYAYCAKELKAHRYEAGLMHALSVSAALSGLEESKVLYGWKKILEADEDNLICKVFIEAYEGNKLTGDAEEYLFDLTDDMLLSLYQRLRSKGATAKEAVRLCYTRDREQLQEAGTWLLLMLEQASARQLIEILSVRPDLSDGAREVCESFIAANGLSGITQHYPLLKIDSASSEPPLAVDSSIWLKHIYTNIVDLLVRYHRSGRLTALKRVFDRAVSNRSVRHEMLLRQNAAEAAVLLLTVKPNANKSYKRRLSRGYRIPVRQLDYMLRKIMCAPKGNKNV